MTAELDTTLRGPCETCGASWEESAADVARRHTDCPKCRRIRHSDWYESRGRDYEP